MKINCYLATMLGIIGTFLIFWRERNTVTIIIGIIILVFSMIVAAYIDNILETSYINKASLDVRE